MKTPATHCCAMSSEIVCRHRITQDRKAYGPDISIVEKEILFLLNVMTEEKNIMQNKSKSLLKTVAIIVGKKKNPATQIFFICLSIKIKL